VGRGEEEWSCSGGTPLVAVVQPADLRDTDHPSFFGRLHGTRLGRLFRQSEMATAVMVVVEKPLEMARQTGLVENDDVVQALPANRADHPFDVGALPGRARGRQHLFDPHGFHLLDEVSAEDPIPIAQQIAGCRVPGKRFSELVSGPLRGRMGSDGEMQNPPTVVCQRQKHRGFETGSLAP
jgi:hypothetical protein